MAHRSIGTHGFNHRLKNFGEVGEAGDCLEFPWKCLHIATSLNLDEHAMKITDKGEIISKLERVQSQ